MKPQIVFDDFAKLDLRVGEIVECKEVEGSEKLLELRVDFGQEIGQKVIYSGIKKWFNPENLSGRKLIFIINLAPRTFKIGKNEFISEGMLMAAIKEEQAVLYKFDEDLPVGALLR